MTYSLKCDIVLSSMSEFDGPKRPTPENKGKNSTRTSSSRGGLRLLLGTAASLMVACTISKTVEAPSVAPESAPTGQTEGFPYTYCDGNFLTNVYVGSDGRWYTNGRGGQRDVVCEIERRFVTPMIESVEPDFAIPGDRVTIKGKNFLQPGVEPHELQVWLVHENGGVGLLTSVLPRYGLPGYSAPNWGQDEISFAIPDVPDQSGRLTVIVGGAGTGRVTRWENEFTISR